MQSILGSAIGLGLLDAGRLTLCVPIEGGLASRLPPEEPQRVRDRLMAVPVLKWSQGPDGELSLT